MTNYNCPNCGAPINAWQCPYCGTVIHDFVNMDFEGHTPTYLRMKVGGKSMVMMAKPVGLTIEEKLDAMNYVYADNVRYAMMPTVSTKVTAEFEVLPDRETLMKIFMKDEE